MSDRLFGLSGDDYWQQPWKNAAALHEKYVLGSVYGLFIDAPPVVDSGARKTLPVPFFYVAEMREAYKVQLDTMTKVVASRVEDRMLKIASAYTPKDKRAPEPKVGRDSTDPTSEREVLDLQAQLKLLNEPGTYHIVVLMRDQMSNVVQTRVEKKTIVNEDPEVVKFLEAQRRPVPPPPPPAPSGELLWAPAEIGPPAAPKALEGSPEIPGEEGIEMGIERVVLNRPGATAVLKGAFRLKVLKRELVPPEPEPLPDLIASTGTSTNAATAPKEAPVARSPLSPENPAPLPIHYGLPRPTAILPITLVVLGYVDLAPTVIRLNIPIYDPVDPAGAEMSATGHFAIDLLANANLRLKPQTFAIYAFCGEFHSGPHLMATVTESMLPKPGE